MTRPLQVSCLKFHKASKACWRGPCRCAVFKGSGERTTDGVNDDNAGDDDDDDDDDDDVSALLSRSSRRVGRRYAYALVQEFVH